MLQGLIGIMFLLVAALGDLATQHFGDLLGPLSQCTPVLWEGSGWVCE